ncbi:Cathepsin propeptide inhibitor domain-containing protein [Plasmodiophora brassicae]
MKSSSRSILVGILIGVVLVGVGVGLYFVLRPTPVKDLRVLVERAKVADKSKKGELDDLVEGIKAWDRNWGHKVKHLPDAEQKEIGSLMTDLITEISKFGYHIVVSNVKSLVGKYMTRATA